MSSSVPAAHRPVAFQLLHSNELERDLMELRPGLCEGGKTVGMLFSFFLSSSFLLPFPSPLLSSSSCFAVKLLLLFLSPNQSATSFFFLLFLPSLAFIQIAALGSCIYIQQEPINKHGALKRIDRMAFWAAFKFMPAVIWRIEKSKVKTWGDAGEPGLFAS